MVCSSHPTRSIDIHPIWLFLLLNCRRVELCCSVSRYGLNGTARSVTALPKYKKYVRQLSKPAWCVGQNTSICIYVLYYQTSGLSFLDGVVGNELHDCTLGINTKTCLVHSAAGWVTDVVIEFVKVASVRVRSTACVHHSVSDVCALLARFIHPVSKLLHHSLCIPWEIFVIARYQTILLFSLSLSLCHMAVWLLLPQVNE